MNETVRRFAPITQDNVDEAFEYIFAPWIKAMGFVDFEVEEGFCRARLPQDTDLHWVGGAMCGQALMAAIDTVAAIATSTSDRTPKGTAHQATQFLRPAAGDELIVEARVLQWGRAIIYVESHIRFAGSGKLIAHATLQFGADAP